MQISQQVIQRELSIDSSQIKHVVRESLKLLPMGNDTVRVYVNPQDFEQIKALRDRHEENWKIIEDDDLLPGGCRFETANTQINASIESRIEHIATQVLDQQRELKSQPLEPDLQVDLDAVTVPHEQHLKPEPQSEPQSEAELEIADPTPAAEQETETEQAPVAEPDAISAQADALDPGIQDSATDEQHIIDEAPSAH